KHGPGSRRTRYEHPVERKRPCPAARARSTAIQRDRATHTDSPVGPGICHWWRWTGQESPLQLGRIENKCWVSQDCERIEARDQNIGRHRGEPQYVLTWHHFELKRVESRKRS